MPISRVSRVTPVHKFLKAWPYYSNIQTLLTLSVLAVIKSYRALYYDHSVDSGAVQQYSCFQFIACEHGKAFNSQEDWKIARCLKMVAFSIYA